MTEALDAMVRAMVEELSRQSAEQGGHYEAEYGVFDANLDIEKVARAGLAAIRDHTDDILGLALYSLPGGYRPGSHSARDILRNQIDAILEREAHAIDVAPSSDTTC